MTRGRPLTSEVSAMKRATVLFTLLLLLVAAAWADQTYIDPASKLQFPATVGGLERREVEDLSAGPGGGVAVQYGGMGDLKARASIFLYTPTFPLAEEMEGTVQAITMSGGELKPLEKRAVSSGRYKGELRRFELLSQGRSLYTEVRLYDMGKTFFKLRLTGELKDRTILQREGDALVAKVLR